MQNFKNYLIVNTFFKNNCINGFLEILLYYVQSVIKKKPDCCYTNFNITYFDNL